MQISLAQLGRASVALSLAVAALSGSSMAVAAQPATSAQTVMFTYTGAAQTWTVPAGVNRATFDVLGAQGGTGAEAPLFSGPGGLGGETIASLPVTAGQVVQVNVGGASANGDSAGCSIGYPMKVSCGGFNGGATSGLGGESAYSSVPGATFNSGVRQGDGQVTITFTVLTPRPVVVFNPTGSQCSCGALTAASVATNFTASSRSQVGMNGGWGNTDVWPVGQIGPSTSINSGQYLTFSVTASQPTTYMLLSVSELSYVGQGPRNAVVRTSLDGFATDVASVSGLNPAGMNQIAFNLANLPQASGRIEFGVYYFNPPATGQDWADLMSTNRAGATGLVLTANLP